MRFGLAAVITGVLLANATQAAIASPKPQVALAVQGVHDLLETAVASETDHNSAAATADTDIRFDGKLLLKVVGTDDITITLPYAEAFGGTLAGGAVFNGRSSSTYARPIQGGAQVVLVATGPSSPTDYPFVIQNGTVAAGPGGALLLFDSTSALNRIVPAPWARDANGKKVTTRFVPAEDGKSFLQEVDHKTAGIVYPVVADPIYARYATGVVVTFSKFETGVLAATSAFTAVWIAAATVAGQLGNKIYHNAWRIQIAAVWEAVHGKCLWVWVPYIGDIETGGYNC